MINDQEKSTVERESVCVFECVSLMIMLADTSDMDALFCSITSYCRQAGLFVSLFCVSKDCTDLPIESRCASLMITSRTGAHILFFQFLAGDWQSGVQ